MYIILIDLLFRATTIRSSFYLCCVVFLFTRSSLLKSAKQRSTNYIECCTSITCRILTCCKKEFYWQLLFHLKCEKKCIIVFMSVHLSFTAHIFLSPIKKLIKPSNSSVDQIELRHIKIWNIFSLIPVWKKVEKACHYILGNCITYRELW